MKKENVIYEAGTFGRRFLYLSEDNLSIEQIEKYGLIQDDVCLVCEK